MRDRPDEQYDLLVKIIKEGRLNAFYKVIYPGGKSVGVPLEKGKPGGVFFNNSFTEGDFRQGTLFQMSSLCFCDIPLSELGLHMGKYGRFGVAFAKATLVPRGASPVFYIEENATEGVHKRSADLEKAAKLYPLLDEMMHSIACDKHTAHLRFDLDDLFYRVFPYMKFFDSTKPDDCESNTYMEREWRMNGNLEFKMSDICRVIIPKTYAHHLRSDLSDYIGQVTFAESVTN